MLGVFCVVLNNQHNDYNYSFIYNDGINSVFHYHDNEIYSALSINKKFDEEKFGNNGEELIVIFDGIVTNNEEVYKKTGVTSIQEGLVQYYNRDGISDFLNIVRGSFCGIIINKKNKTVCGFTDHWSSKPLFYSVIDKAIIVSSEVSTIVEFYNSNNKNIHIDLVGAYSLLTNAYMIEDHTIITEIKRINPGTVFHYNNGKIINKIYHKWKFDEINISKNDAVEEIDNLFKQAVDKQIKKNNKYDYKNVVPLSAGLDCRIASFVASELTDGNILNFSYSETGQYDEILPAKMARAQRHQWIFKNLDNGLDLYNIDSSIKIAEGLIYYPWVSQLNTFLELVNTEKWGIVHTGVIGDVVIGSFCKSIDYVNRKYSLGDGAYSTKLIPKLKSYISIDKYNYEEGMMRNRAINGACMGYSTSFRRYCEAMSPFMDVDFAEFCFSLPHKYRIQHQIYYEWIIKKYKEVAVFPHNGVKISNGKRIRYGKKEYHIDTIPSLIKNTIKSKIKNRNGMNPMDYWIHNNKKLKNHLDSYYLNNRTVISGNRELFEDTCRLYDNGNAIEKTLVISLLGTCQQFGLYQ